MSDFAYQSHKDGSVFIFWHGKKVTTLRGWAAQEFMEDVSDADEEDQQLTMAKVTGHFKHGNEPRVR